MNKITKSLIGSSTAVLILRIIIGIVFFAHGAQKVMGWFGGYGLSGTAAYFQQTWDIPSIFFYMHAFMELLGGIAMVFGIMTRLFSLGLAINMLIAIILVHIQQGFFGPEGFEYPLILLIVTTIIFLIGPGRFSLDKAVLVKNNQQIT